MFPSPVHGSLASAHQGMATSTTSSDSSRSNSPPAPRFTLSQTHKDTGEGNATGNSHSETQQNSGPTNTRAYVLASTTPKAGGTGRTGTVSSTINLLTNAAHLGLNGASSFHSLTLLQFIEWYSMQRSNALHWSPDSLATIAKERYGTSNHPLYSVPYETLSSIVFDFDHIPYQLPPDKSNMENSQRMLLYGVFFKNYPDLLSPEAYERQLFKARKAPMAELKYLTQPQIAIALEDFKRIQGRLQLEPRSADDVRNCATMVHLAWIHELNKAARGIQTETTPSTTSKISMPSKLSKPARQVKEYSPKRYEPYPQPTQADHSPERSTRVNSRSEASHAAITGASSSTGSSTSSHARSSTGFSASSSTSTSTSTSELFSWLDHQVNEMQLSTSQTATQPLTLEQQGATGTNSGLQAPDWLAQPTTSEAEAFPWLYSDHESSFASQPAPERQADSSFNLDDLRPDISLTSDWTSEQHRALLRDVEDATELMLNDYFPSNIQHG